MAKRNVIVRALPAVEGLGACTLIASDKTGTLTQNRLAVGALVLADGRRVTLVDPAAQALVECALLASEGSLAVAADGTAQRVGDSVDLAFHDLALRHGLRAVELRPLRHWVMLVPYEPQLRLSAALTADRQGALLAVKGAPETLLALAAGTSAALHESVATLTAEGYRVLAVAQRRLAQAPVDEAEPLSLLADLTILGFAGLSDALRPEAAAAVAACAAGGIQVDMVTGDHPATALAVARQLGIARDPAEVVTGQALAAAGGSLAALVRGARVFARVEPLQKLAIVEARLAEGHFVAVTGDGVNDAPALKAASIGVAMGKSGTDVAREAADLILTDDNFASIVAGVEEGRIAYANVRKVILLLLATGLAEVLIFLIALVVALPLPLFATQLLWLNLVTNGSQDVALGLEPGEPGIGRQRPRNPKEPLVDRRLFRLILVLGLGMGALAGLCYGLLLGQGHPEGEARTALLLLLVAMENIAALSCRSDLRSLFRTPLFGNPWLLASVMLALTLQVLAFLIPPLRDALRLEVPLWSALAWLPAFLLGYLALAEGAKGVMRRRVGRDENPGL
jgi:magnesium-transporting ATPase (P-type)